MTSSRARWLHLIKLVHEEALCALFAHHEPLSVQEVERRNRIDALLAELPKDGAPKVRSTGRPAKAGFRARCNSDTWNEGVKDPELTTGKFYTVLDARVLVMNAETPEITVVGDSGVEVTRPKHVFHVVG